MLSNEQLKELSEPNLFRWLFYVVIDWFFVGLVLFQAQYFNTVWSYVLAIVLLGSLQHAIAILGHDGAHRRICKNKKWNDRLTIYLCMAPMGMPLKLYRDFHFGHHRYLGTSKDGEISYKQEFAPLWDLPVKKSKIYQYVFLDYIGMSIPVIIKMMKGTNEAQLSDRIPVFVFWTVVVTATFITNTLWILPIWFAATLTSFYAAFRFRLWCEHMGTAGTYRYQTEWWQRLLFLPHNIDIHWEHHLYPSIPFWNLKKVRELTKDDEPIIPLSEVFNRLEKMPEIPSGTVLKKPVKEKDFEADCIIIDEAS